MSALIKQICLVRGSDDESYNAFRERVHKESLALTTDKNIRNVSYTITTAPPPVISIIPFRKQKIAAISLKNSGEPNLDNLWKTKGFAGIYPVTEALPVAYKKTWPDGEKTPGVCLLTLFRRKKGVDFDRFIDRWHNSHTPLSLKIHPLWHYNRNVITGREPESCEPWEGIVEEHTRHRSELLNPFKFFGNPFVILPRMLKVYTDTKSFLDYKTIETYLVAEYHITS